MTTWTSSSRANCKAKALLFGVLAFASAQVIGILSAQAMPGESDRFEVASIRPSGSEGLGASAEFTPGGGVRATNVTLKLLIQLAYGIRPEQLSGGPGWADSEQYSVIAKGPAGTLRSEPGQQELTRKRLQALLGERFHLALKREAKPVAGYVLTVEKTGHKMTLVNDPDARQLRQLGRWELRADGVEMSTLARFLSAHLSGTVIDRTELEGRYAFQLNWNPGAPIPGAPDSSASGLPEESLIPAVEEQLGLRLERQKVATDQYTIERAERPSEN
jgi:bla regulator protein BlaR1